MVFQHFVNSSFNLYTGSYIFRALQVIETVPCVGTSNGHVRRLFQQIQEAIHQRKLPCFVGHIRAHSSLPGPLADGNASAGKLTQMATLSQGEYAQQSHSLHHQNSRSLRKQFGLTRELLIRLLSNVMCAYSICLCLT